MAYKPKYAQKKSVGTRQTRENPRPKPRKKMSKGVFALFIVLGIVIIPAASFLTGKLLMCMARDLGLDPHDQECFAVIGLGIHKHLALGADGYESAAVLLIIEAVDQIPECIGSTLPVDGIAKDPVGRGEGVGHTAGQGQTSGLGIVDLHIDGDSAVETAVFFINNVIAGPEGEDAVFRISLGPSPQGAESVFHKRTSFGNQK